MHGLLSRVICDLAVVGVKQSETTVKRHFEMVKKFDYAQGVVVDG